MNKVKPFKLNSQNLNHKISALHFSRRDNSLIHKPLPQKSNSKEWKKRNLAYNEAK